MALVGLLVGCGGDEAFGGGTGPREAGGGASGGGASGGGASGGGASGHDAGADGPIGGSGAIDASLDSTTDATPDAPSDARLDTGPDADAATNDAGPAPPRPIMDGRFDDWEDSPVLATDPTGDASGLVDLVALRAQSRGSELFLQLEWVDPLNLPNTGRPPLLVGVGLPHVHITFDFADRLVYLDRDPRRLLDWSAVGFQYGPTHADRRVEIEIDLTPFSPAPGDPVTIEIDGSDTLDTAVTHPLVHPPAPIVRREAQRHAETWLRLVSFNLFASGLFDERADAQGRLVTTAAADGYCFQENNETVSDNVARMGELLPLDAGQSWTVQESGSVVLATEFPTIPIASTNLRYVAAGAVIEGRPVIIACVHLPCCGAIGSTLDAERTTAAQAVVDAIEELRSGNLDSRLTNAPTVVLGDFNLVGSRDALDLFDAPTGLGFTQQVMPHLVGPDVFTWNNAASPFPPSILDLVVFSPDLQRPSGYVLSTDDLNDAELAGLGLVAGDSRSSDHLMVVVDFD